MTDAIDLLKQQHEEVNELFDEIEQAEDEEEKLALFLELAENLAAHASIEEKIFYPAAYARKTKVLLTEAVEEHLSMKRVIADLLEMSPDHENFDAKVKVLREQVEHHVEEEEGELFKKVRRELGAEEMKRLGAEMKKLFQEEMANGASATVSAQTDEAAPLH